MNQLHKSSFTGVNITSNVLLATFSTAGATETSLAAVSILLKSVYGLGSTYRFTLKKIDEDSNECFFPESSIVVSKSSANIALQFSDLAIKPNETLEIYCSSSNSNDTSINGTVWIFDTTTTSLSSAGSAALLNENIDSTGAAAVSLKRSLEAMMAVLLGNASFDGTTGIEAFKGRDGTTTIVTNKLAGNGVRTESTIQ